MQVPNYPPTHFDIPANFKEKVEEMLRAGTTRDLLEKEFGYHYNSTLLNAHIKQTWGCSTITDLRALLGVNTSHYQGPVATPKLVKAMRRHAEFTAKTAQKFWPIFEKHTCFMPVGWKASVSGNPLVRGWSTSTTAKELREGCPECQAGRLLPGVKTATDRAEPLAKLLASAEQFPVPEKPKKQSKPRGPRVPKQQSTIPAKMGRPIKEGSWRWRRLQPRQLCVNGCGKMSTLYSEWCTGEFCSSHCGRAYATKLKREDISKRVSETLKQRHLRDSS